MANVMANVVLRSYKRNAERINEAAQTWKEQGETGSHMQKTPGNEKWSLLATARQKNRQRSRGIEGDKVNHITGGRASTASPTPTTRKSPMTATNMQPTQ